MKSRDAAAAREASLLAMRNTMLASEHFSAAFFIGRMEGVEAEFDLVRKVPYRVPCYRGAARRRGSGIACATTSRERMNHTFASSR